MQSGGAGPEFERPTTAGPEIGGYETPRVVETPVPRKESLLSRLRATFTRDDDGPGFKPPRGWRPKGLRSYKPAKPRKIRRRSRPDDFTWTPDAD